MSKTFVLKHILSIASLFHRRTAILFLHVIERYVLLEDSVVRLMVLIENLDYQYVMNNLEGVGVDVGVVVWVWV